jgi:hypothetical protein
MKIVRCLSCNGYGWHEEDDSGGSPICGWCDGVGYVYRDTQGIDHAIPSADFEQISDTLEALETERMHEIGYRGEARKPWEQAIRKGTKGGIKPESTDDEEN